MKCLSRTIELTNLKAASLEHAPDLQVRLCAVNGVNYPLDFGEGLAARIPFTDRGEEW